MKGTRRCLLKTYCTSIESARSEHSNGVWYVFSRAHPGPIEQLTYYSIHHYDSRYKLPRGTNYPESPVETDQRPTRTDQRQNRVTRLLTRPLYQTTGTRTGTCTSSILVMYCSAVGCSLLYRVHGAPVPNGRDAAAATAAGRRCPRRGSNRCPFTPGARAFAH